MIAIWHVLVDGMRFLLQWLFGLTVTMGVPSYALAIVLLTVLTKVVLAPLYFKQMASMRQMQMLQPLIKQIQAKNKGKDPRQSQEEVMALYREHGVNPMGGCLPLVVQMPIIYALYRALLTFNMPKGAAGGLLWIHSLNQKDPYWVIPILVAVTTFWQSWLTTPSKSDPTQKSMLYFMPLIFGYLTAMWPAALGLYWLTFNVTGVAQQYIVNRMTPPPVKEVREVADDRKSGKDNRGSGGGGSPRAKGAARSGRSRGSRRSNKRNSGSTKQTGTGEIKS